ncbi:hypothetical protein NPIL_314921 [Nephila pilipes]|uniref:Uncharacterized protein n=1 Tax=Nephila pilipes TaxID=299642 RepID=A0A8X6IKZ4_NEPPI|nr:hypothetical protein NPIL_314921 [Nephila pilipes]
MGIAGEKRKAFNLMHLYINSRLRQNCPNGWLVRERDANVPECDEVDKQSLNRRLRFRQKFMQNLRKRYMSKYQALYFNEENPK